MENLKNKLDNHFYCTRTHARTHTTCTFSQRRARRLNYSQVLVSDVWWMRRRYIKSKTRYVTHNDSRFRDDFDENVCAGNAFVWNSARRKKTFPHNNNGTFFILICPENVLRRLTENDSFLVRTRNHIRQIFRLEKNKNKNVCCTRPVSATTNRGRKQKIWKKKI